MDFGDRRIEFSFRTLAGGPPSRQEVLADLKARGSNAVMGDGFAQDIEDGVKAQRQPNNSKI